MSQNTGTLVGAPVRPADSNDIFPTFYVEEGRGGIHSYPSYTDMEGIILSRRRFGMIVTITEGTEAGNTYQLKNLDMGGVSDDLSDNSNWIPYSLPVTTPDLQQVLNAGSMASILDAIDIVGTIFTFSSQGQGRISVGNGVGIDGQLSGVNLNGGINGIRLNGQSGLIDLQAGLAGINIATDGSLSFTASDYIINNRPFNYGADFSSLYTDRSLVDKFYVDTLVGNSIREAGDWDASSNTFPTTGTGVSGQVRRGDTYRVTVAGNPFGGSEILDVGDSFRALTNNPGQTVSNWAKFEVNTAQATASYRGTMFLFTSTGTGTNGTMTQNSITTALNTKQNTLISGTNIKTIGGQSLLGSGDVTEVQNNLTASTVLAPSVTATNNALALKVNKAGDVMTGSLGVNDIYNTSAATNSRIQLLTSGVVITRDAAGSSSVLTLTALNAGATGNSFELYQSTSLRAAFTTSGILRTPEIIHLTDSNSAKITISNNGVIVSRNVADANWALKAVQLNTSSTADIIRGGIGDSSASTETIVFRVQYNGRVKAAQAVASDELVRLDQLTNYSYKGKGTSTQSANGSSTSFTITHGLSGITSSNQVVLTPKRFGGSGGSSPSAGWTSVEVSSTAITIYYSVAPPSGTNNWIMDWFIY